jgi:hypothetical protein
MHQNITPFKVLSVYQVNINGCAIKVFSKSYLGLGGDDPRRFMRAHHY